MADVKVVRGTLGGAVVETSEENAGRLGSAFQPEKASETAPTEVKKTGRTRHSTEADDSK